MEQGKKKGQKEKDGAEIKRRRTRGSIFMRYRQTPLLAAAPSCLPFFSFFLSPPFFYLSFPLLGGCCSAKL